MPDGDFFAFGEYDWGLLRLIYAVIWENKGTVTMNSFNTIQKTWVRTEGVEGAIADFVCFHCPLVASAEAKPLLVGKTSRSVAPIWRDNVQVVDRAAWGRV